MIGNPPYGAKVRTNERDLYKDLYLTAKSIKGVQKGSTDTYTVFLEQGFNLLRKNGTLMYIVPISVTSSDSLIGLHNLLKDNCDIIKVSSYAVRPQPVFKNAVVNTSIIQFTKTLTSCKQLLSTKMHRKGRGFNLQRLINNLRFIEVNKYVLKGRIPKISLPIEVSILNRLAHFKKVSTFIDIQGCPIYYRTTGGRYFKVVTNYSTGSTKEKPLYLNKEYFNAIGCILSSNLAFWFYQIYSNNLDWKSYEIESFPIPYLNNKDIMYLNNLYEEYLHDIELHTKIKTSSENSSYKVTSFKEYKIGFSKNIIDKIDNYICPLYGLNQAEINFIKTYELEFRLTDENN